MEKLNNKTIQEINDARKNIKNGEFYKETEVSKILGVKK